MFVVNLLLARIEGPPAGIKGISLFVVPKMRPDEKRKLVSNDLNCVSIYHKLGVRGRWGLMAKWLRYRSVADS